MAYRQKVMARTPRVSVTQRSSAGGLRLPETLSPQLRRSLRIGVVLDGFRLVVSNRSAFAYGPAGTFMFAFLFGFRTCAQQIYVDIYGLGPYFPVAFASVAALMGLSSFTDSRLVARVGMRRLPHGAILIFTPVSGFLLVLAPTGNVPLWLFLPLLAVIMNSLSMEPLGAVAGRASSAFGFIHTVAA